MNKLLIGLIALCCTLASAQTPNPAAPPMRLRATIEKIEGNSMTVKERSGEVITLVLADNLNVSEVFPIALAAIQPGSFIGTAAMPRADGTLDALEVLVLPEAARGNGEGHRPYDLQPGSTMTNATVADLVAAPTGRKLTLRYKDGEKTVNVSDTTPVVSFRPGDRSLLVVGGKVIVTAELRSGVPTATRVLAGRDGFAPPL